ncbi:MAG: tetratricopeptide repeat protein [Deltaproteobacteria bacterium]|nr:tetratricopeptide repeat protein [Deltaproteobacteria bacterium]
MRRAEGALVLGLPAGTEIGPLLAHRLEIEVPGAGAADADADGSAAPERWQRRRGRVREAHVELREAAVQSWLGLPGTTAALERRGFAEVRIGFEAGRITVRAAYRDPRAPERPDTGRSPVGVVLRGGLEADGDDGVLVVLDDVLVELPEGRRGPELPGALIARAFLQGLGAVPASDPEALGATAVLVGVAQARVVPLRAALFHLLPPAGWRVPDVRGARVARAQVGAHTVELVCGGESLARPDGRSELEQQLEERIASARRFDQAESALATGDLPRAAGLYLAALAEGAYPPFVLERALDVLGALPDRVDEARAVAEGALARDPRCRPALHLLARLCDQRGERAEAGALLRRLADAVRVAGDPESARELALGAARRLLEAGAGHERAAIDALAAGADDAGPGGRAARLLLGQAVEQAAAHGEWDAVERGAATLLPRASVDPVPGEPAAAELLRLMAQAADRAGHERDALERYQAILERPDQPAESRAHAWERLAQLAERDGDLARAIEVLVEAGHDSHAGGPGERAERLYHAAELVRRGLGGTNGSAPVRLDLTPAEAARRREQLLEDALRVKADHLPALDALETLHAEAGDLERVAVILGRKIAATGRAPERKRALLVRLADLQLELGHRDAARAAYERALELEPRNLPALRALAVLAFDAGELGQARERWQLLLERAAPPGTPGTTTAGPGPGSDDELLLEAHLSMAEIARRERRSADEEAELGLALALDPHSAAAFDALERNLAAAGRWPEVRALLDRRAPIEPDAGRRVDHKLRAAAIVLDRLKSPREAADLLERVLALAPEHPLALERLAAALGHLGAHQARVFTLERLAARVSAASTVEAAHLPRPAAVLATAARVALEGLGDPVRARALAGRALAADLDDPHAADVVARVTAVAPEAGPATPAPPEARGADGSAVALARVRFADGDLTGALTALSGLDEATAPAEALHLAAELYELGGQLRHARWALEALRWRARAAGDAGQELELLRRLAGLASKLGLEHEAEALLLRTVAIEPDDDAAAATLATLYQRRGDDARYAAMLERQLQIARRTRARPERVLDLMITRAQVLLGAGRNEEAGRALRDASEAAPRDGRVLRLWTDLALAQGAFAEAARTLEVLARATGSRGDTAARAELYLELAAIYLDRLHDRAKASDTLRHAAAAAPPGPAADAVRRAEGRVAWDVGDHAAVVTALETLAPRARQRDDVERLAASLVALGRRDEALLVLREALARGAQLGGVAWVATLGRTVHDLDPTDLDALQAVAARIGTGAELLAYTEELARRVDDSDARVELFHQLGALRRAEGDAAGAVYAYQRALDEAPLDSEALMGVIEAAQAAGALEHAAAALTRAIEHERDPMRRAVLEQRRDVLVAQQRAELQPPPLGDEGPEELTPVPGEWEAGRARARHESSQEATDPTTATAAIGTETATATTATASTTTAAAGSATISDTAADTEERRRDKEEAERQTMAWAGRVAAVPALTTIHPQPREPALEVTEPAAPALPRTRSAVPFEDPDDARLAAEARKLVEQADGLEDAEARRDVLIRAADIYEYELHELDDAGLLIAQAYKLDPAMMGLGNRAARLLTRAGDLAAALAVRELQISSSADPARTALRAERASLLHLIGRSAEAERELAEVLVTAPGLGSAHLALGRLRAARLEGRPSAAAERDAALRHLTAAAESPDVSARDAAAAAIMAAHLHEAGREPDKARARYEDALRLDPADPRAPAALERIYRELGDYDALAEVLGRLIVLSPSREERARLWFRRALLYRDVLDREPETYRCLKEALANDPGHREVAEALRVAAAARGDWTLVAELLHRELATTHHPGARAAVYGRLGAVYEQRLLAPERALKAYEEAAVIDSSNLEARVGLARLYSDARRYADAAAIERALAALAPDAEQRAEHLARAGEHEEKAGSKDAARALYREAADAAQHRGNAASSAARGLLRLTEDPADRAHLREVLLGELGETTDSDERLEILRKLLITAETSHAAGLDPAGTDADIETRAREILLLEPADSAAFLALKALLVRRGDASALAELLRRRAEAQSDDRERAALRFELGRLFEARLQDPARAALAYEMALADDPGHAAARDALADLAYRQGDFPRARLRYQELDEHTSSLGLEALRYRRGELAERLGLFDEAATLYQRAVEVNPSHLEALQGVARLAQQRGDAEGAARALRQALELLPLDDVRAITGMRQQVADLYQKAGQLGEAQAFYELVVAEDPERVSALLPLSALYAAAGEWERAAEVLGRLAALFEAPERRADLLYRQGEVLLLHLRDTERASAAYLKAIDLLPTHVPTILRLIDYYWEEASWSDVAELGADLDHLGALAGTPGAPIAASGEAARRLARIAVAQAMAGDPPRTREGSIACVRLLAESEGAARAVSSALIAAVPYPEGPPVAGDDPRIPIMMQAARVLVPMLSIGAAAGGPSPGAVLAELTQRVVAAGPNSAVRVAEQALVRIVRAG